MSFMDDPEYKRLEKEFNDCFDEYGNLKGFPPLSPEKRAYINAEVIKQTTPAPQPQQPPQPQRPTPNFNFGPNTQDVNGTPIDFDRILNMSTVESPHNGATTYGIRFDFKGSRGLSRTVWFNRNKELRDQTFHDKYSFWDTLNMIRSR